MWIKRNQHSPNQIRHKNDRGSYSATVVKVLGIGNQSVVQRRLVPSRMITGNVRGARRMLPDPDWKVEDQTGVRAMTSGDNKDKDNDDDQGGGIPAWMFKRSNQEKTVKSAPRKRNSKKKPAQPKEIDDGAKRIEKVKEGSTEEENVAGPVVTRAQTKKSDKVHPLKVKEAMSSVDKSTIENLQKKDSTLKKCWEAGHQRELCRRVLQEEWIALLEASRNEDGTKFYPVSQTQGTSKTGDVFEP